MKHRFTERQEGRRPHRPAQTAQPMGKPSTDGTGRVSDQRDTRGSGGPTARAELTEADIREAWLRAEACCECDRQNHGHLGRCDQFLLWTERGASQKGGWEPRLLQDPRRPVCEILCAACYAKSMGHTTSE